MEYDYLIVGSGPGGVSAARQLCYANTAILDVGYTPDRKFKHSKLSEALESGDMESLLGTNWETLDNIESEFNIHRKIKSADLRYVMNGEIFRVYDSNGRFITKGNGSYAKGGMANVWGAQLLKYNKKDLDEVNGWPISINELEAYYTELEDHIGISGVNDDMSQFLGESDNLLPPVELSITSKYLLNNYNLLKAAKPDIGIKVGRARVAVSTVDRNGFAKYKAGSTEFFKPTGEGIYNPKNTLDSLIQNKSISYFSNQKLIKYKEFEDYVEIITTNNKNEYNHYKTKHLLLACGTIQTAKLVLMNEQLTNARINFVDHPPILLPFIFPKCIGNIINNDYFPIQLTATLNNKRDMISLYHPAGMMKTEYLLQLPIPLNLSKNVLSLLLNSMLIAQIWETSTENNGCLYLDDNCDICIKYPYPKKKNIFKLIYLMFQMGGITVPNLASRYPPTWGYHHAGTLPMSLEPGLLQTHTDGRLWKYKRIRVIDGSVLPSLPAKNHSLTLMANSARIADLTKKCGY